MYAIVEIAGKQFKVTQDQFIYAPRMQGDEGASVEFDRVLLVGNDGNVEVGAPLLSGVTVSGKILGHVKGDKVIVFKKKRRKGYKVKNGHRQDFTKIQIADILTGGKGTSKKSTPVKEEKKKETPKKIKGDDLTQISGIGPVFAEELVKMGYSTFEQIATLKKEEIVEIAEKIDGISEDLVKNEEWKKQAKELMKGKDAGSKPVKKPAVDDLTKISGIGPVFAKELSKAGYTSYEQIASLTKQQIAEIAEKVDGVSEDLVQNEEWKKQAKDLIKADTAKTAKPSKAKKEVADDLTEISGIGPVFAKELGKLGYKTFDQIASLTKTQIAEIAEKIDGVSEDLVENEEWIKQAKALKKK